VLNGNDILVEVDVYIPTRHAKVLRKIRKLARYYK